MALRRCARFAGTAWQALNAPKPIPSTYTYPALITSFTPTSLTHSSLLPPLAAAAAGPTRGFHASPAICANARARYRERKGQAYAALGSEADRVARLASKGQVIKGEVPEAGLLALNTLKPNTGARPKAKILGRGTGGGRGKTCGRGHKGQYQRGNGPRLGFEGGQTPLAIRTRKRGFSNQMHQREYRYVNLKKISDWIDQGRLDSTKTITMKDLRDTGCINKKVTTGVRLLGAGASKFTHKIDLQISKVTLRAREAVEAAGGSVSQVYYNELGLRALFKPAWFPKKGRLLPRSVRRIPTRFAGRFDVVGQLPPKIDPDEQ